MDNNKVLKAGLIYVKDGIKVFPLGPNSKIPLPGSAGFKDASDDPEQIREWFEEHPERNIGIPTSIENGFFVLDVDVDPVKKLDGEADLLELEAKFGPLPETLMQITPRGGRHLLFRHPKDREIKNGKVGGYKSLDIRGEGGYIATQPSKVDGKGYTWSGGKPDFNRIAEAPDWLLENIGKNPSKLDRAMTHLKGKKYPPSIAEEEWLRRMEPVEQGGRHMRLLQIAGLLINKLPGCVATSMLDAWNTVNCSPPLPDDEVYRILEDLAVRNRGGHHGA